MNGNRHRQNAQPRYHPDSTKRGSRQPEGCESEQECLLCLCKTALKPGSTGLGGVGRMGRDEDSPYKDTQQREYLSQENSGIPGFPLVFPKTVNFLLHFFPSSEKLSDSSP